MHNTVRYTGSMKDKDTKAIMDIRNWLGGDKKLIEIADHMASHLLYSWSTGNSLQHTIDQMRFYMSFAGVQGYPVTALYRRLLHAQFSLAHAAQPRTPIAWGPLYALYKHSQKLVKGGYAEKKDLIFTIKEV